MRSVRVVILVPLTLALTLGLTSGLLAPVPAPPASALGWSPVVDAPAGYDAQTACTKVARPGTVALARWLLRTYRATRSMGTMRACRSGGQSEHKDGRAFDWGADVAKPATRRAAYDFIRKALATDAAGNEHALARRLGIMYLIYHDTIWSSYRDFAPRPYLNAGCRSRKKCSRTLRHLNHVHISLGYAGAAAQTSWYRARNIASAPVLYPGTPELDPDLTAVTGFSVPATGALTTSPFYLRAGVSYRIVATGLVRLGAGDAAGEVVGDATCTGTGVGADYAPTSRGLLGLPLPDTHGLLLAGALRWQDDCRADHTYEAWYTPLTRQRLQLKYVDVPAADNTGAFTVYVAREDVTASSLAGS